MCALDLVSCMPPLHCIAEEDGGWSRAKREPTSTIYYRSSSNKRIKEEEEDMQPEKKKERKKIRVLKAIVNRGRRTS